jgi:hypothetical protein
MLTFDQRPGSVMGVPAERSARSAVELLAERLLCRPGSFLLRDQLDGGALATVKSDLLRVLYRVVLAGVARQRGGVLDELTACAGLDLCAVPRDHLTADLLAQVAAAAAPVVQWAPDHVALGALHEALLAVQPVWDGERFTLADTGGTTRKAAGAYFTPARLVEHVLDRALDPALDEAVTGASGDDAARLLAVTVCDPSCGSGLFLVAATRRIAARVAAGRGGGDLAAARLDVVTRCIHGVDLDAAALELARVCLWLELIEPGVAVPMPELGLSVEDALLGTLPRRQFDVVVGNPPFLNQLERLTVSGAGVATRLNELSGGVLRPYTDISAVFLHRSVSWVRPGGRVALVQPQSLLAARDAAGVRADLAERCALESLWASDVPLFDASVLTCAPVLRRGGRQGAVRRSHGPAFNEMPPRAVRPGELSEEWAFLLAAGLGIPEVVLAPAPGVLGDLAACTADFRDQYYGLAPFVREADECRDGTECRGCREPRCAPLVTTGLIDPAESWWGRRPTRFLKQRWAAPVIDLDALEAAPALARWARSRLVPKVLVGTQGKVVEAVVDVEGRWLPSVPTITVAAPPDRLWHVLAVLLAPPVAAHAAATYAGTALNMRAIKLSAAQVARLPLPADLAAWDDGARCAERAQRDGRRHLEELGRTMCRAYGVDDDVLEWWLGRLGLGG